MTERLYHIIAIDERSGAQTLMTSYPMPHAQACIMISKFDPHPARRIQLVEDTK